jgi:site-specific recombinase XerD
MRRWDSLLESYVQQVDSRGVSKDMIASVRREISRWGIWLKSRRPKPTIEKITIEQIQGYIRSRTAFKAKSTVFGTVSVMRQFGEFLVRENLWPKNPLKWIKGPKIDYRQQIPTRIGKESMKKIWQAAANLANEYQRALHLVILSLLYGTGLRKGELVRLKISGWDRINKIIKIDGNKTGSERNIPLPEFAWRCLESYLPLRHNKIVENGNEAKESLLINKHGRPISAEAVLVMVKKLANKAGVLSITLHQFRHTCASDLLEEGIALPQVQEILGHASIYSTFRYIQIASPDLVKAMAMHPVNKILSGNNLQEVVNV